MEESRDLNIDVNPSILSHLGLNTSWSFPEVIAEFVAMAWDRGASKVEITVPQERLDDDYSVTSEDDGRGLEEGQLSQFFTIGGSRGGGAIVADADGRARKSMGQGISGFVGFAVANRIGLETWIEGERASIEIDYDELVSSTEASSAAEYAPSFDVTKDSKKGEGLRIELGNLRRDKRPAARWVRENLARLFAIKPGEFQVVVNGEPVTLDDRNLKDRCQFVWEVDDVEIGVEDHQIRGWIGTFEKPVPEEIKNGVTVMANGRLVQEPSLFETHTGGITGQFALQYLVGVIHADFLESEATDAIVTDRSEVLWHEPPAAELHSYLHDKIVSICREWPELRSEVKDPDGLEGVDIELLEKPIDQLLEEGESERVEFKRESPNSADSLAEEVAALANNDGGLLLLGITDGGDIFGLDNPEQTEERIANIVRNNIDPPATVSISSHAIPEGDIVAVEIDAQVSEPCAVNGRYVGRVGTSKATLTYPEMKDRFQ